MPTFCFVCIHILFLKQGGKKDHLLSLFHHLHHSISDRKIEHEVHHCGGKHKGKDINYTISHCSHNKHRIDKEDAIGHGTTHGDDLLAVKIHFTEKCSDGGWHIESGKINDD